MDLNTFLTSQDKQEKYLGNILECAQTGDSLYAVSPAFTLEFIVGDGSRLGMENGWGMEEMMKSFEKNGSSGSALGKGGVRTVALAKKSGAYADYLKGLSDGDRIFLDEYMNVLNHAHFKEEQRVVGNCMRPITKAGDYADIHIISHRFP